MRNICIAFSMLFIFVSACDDVGDRVPTKRDIAHQIGTAFCEKSMECGYLAPEKLEECISHNEFHLCEIDMSCSEELTDAQAAALSQCVLELPEQGCGAIFWGIVPESCIPLL